MQRIGANSRNNAQSETGDVRKITHGEQNRDVLREEIEKENAIQLAGFHDNYSPSLEEADCSCRGNTKEGKRHLAPLGESEAHSAAADSAEAVLAVKGMAGQVAQCA
jgi:hypothetical protein